MNEDCRILIVIYLKKNDIIIIKNIIYEKKIFLLLKYNINFYLFK
jgi:hypothetical protein